MVKSKFASNEIVMALDKGKYYEAKVLKVQNIGTNAKYFIHFNGWSRKYDAWTDEHLLTKKVEKNSRSKAQLQKNEAPEQQEESNGKSASKDGDDKNKNANGQKSQPKANRKRKAESEFDSSYSKSQVKALIQEDLIDEEEDAVQKVPIPPTLKKHLVDDWSLITHEPRRLVQLPRNHSVDELITEYLKEKKGKVDKEQYSQYQELFDGLKSYFNKALSKILLFRQEREQYTILQAKGVPVCQIYGAEHLLRLFARLPRLMCGLFLAPSEINQVSNKLSDFLKFVQKNSDVYVNLGDYILYADAIEYAKSNDVVAPRSSGRKKSRKNSD